MGNCQNKKLIVPPEHEIVNPALIQDANDKRQSLLQKTITMKENLRENTNNLYKTKSGLANQLYDENKKTTENVSQEINMSIF